MICIFANCLHNSFQELDKQTNKQTNVFSVHFSRLSIHLPQHMSTKQIFQHPLCLSYPSKYCICNSLSQYYVPFTVTNVILFNHPHPKPCSEKLNYVSMYIQRLNLNPSLTNPKSYGLATIPPNSLMSVDMAFNRVETPLSLPHHVFPLPRWVL